MPKRRSESTAVRDPALVTLVVDDDELSGRLLRANLERPGVLRVETCTSGNAALERLRRGGLDAIVTDLFMPGMDGLELVKRVRSLDRSLPVIVLTANGTVERAVEAIRAGATEFLQKPANATALRALIERAVTERPVREELAERRARVAGGVAEYLPGDHPRLAVLRSFAEQVARVPDARVLITGETGTGKSRLAHAIHEISAAPGRLVEVNCAALPAHLLESELFGHEPGAFTDARQLRRGLVELADRGTLFLDEIGTMSLDVQAKLLLFIEGREIRRLGGTDMIPVRTRLITATHDDLRARVGEGSFRQDLLFRLDVASVAVPPLREMPEVIPELTSVLVREVAAELGRPIPPLDPACLERLQMHSWPGNIRELRNAVERALIFHSSGPLTVQPPPESAPPRDPDGGVFLPRGLSLDEVERRYIGAMVEQTPEGKLGELAARLGISRKTLWEKRRRANR